MASIDERVVAMSFENTKFEAGVAVTMATLAKLNASIAGLGKNATGFADIERAAAKVHLEAPMSALDKLKQRLGFASQGAPEAFGAIEKSSTKVELTAPIAAIDKVQTHLATVGTGAAEGFGQIERASNRVNLLGLSSAIDSVQSKFSALTITASSALSTLVMDATRQGRALANSLSLGPVTQGFDEYTTNLKSIQTILANTKASGAGLKEVNAALDELNEYSDKTIYNFSQMANNIGLFTAAGVDLKTSVSSIKGLANLAALSGTTNEKATHAMTQLSQAVAAGKVTMQDWISVRNAGMGGTVFQRALAETAQAMGTVDKGAVSLHGKMKNVKIEGEAFTESIRMKPGEKSWLTSKVLTETLKQFTGDLSDAELAAQGFSQAQIDAIQETAKTAKKAATEVKDIKQLLDVTKEAIGTGWSDSFEIIFGNFTEAKKTFTGFQEDIGKIVGGVADARNKILAEWKELGGRDELIKGIKAAFEALGSVLKPIKDAFREIFPRKTGEDLHRLTVAFREFMENLKLGPETADLLKRTLAGLFAVFHIGFTIVKGVLGVIFDLIGVMGPAGEGFLGLTAGIGDWIVALDSALSKGEGLNVLFETLSKKLGNIGDIIKVVVQSFTSLFGGGEGEGQNLKESLDGVTGSLEPMAKILKGAIQVWEEFFHILEDVWEFLEPILGKIGEVFSQVGDVIVKAFEDVDFDKVATVIQTGLLAGIGVGIKKLLGGIGLDLTGGSIGQFKDVMKTLSSTLTTIQTNIKAQTMLLIAAAVLALAGAAIIFSKIDPKKLAQAMAAISVGIAQMVGAMFLLGKSASSFVQLPFIATAILILAGAMIVLGAAVHIFARLDWDEMAKGLVGVAGGMLAIAGPAKLMSGPQMLLIGPSLIATAIAMNLLGVAMKVFADMSWEEMAKGLAGMAGGLLAVGLATKALGPSVLLLGLLGPGLILTAVGLTILSGAIHAFGNMNIGTLAKGIIGIGAALVVLGVAVMAIPPTIALQAAGLVILGIALTGIATAIGVMGSLGVLTIAKGLAAIAAALIIFAVGLTAMAGTLPGSLALLAAAAAFAILTPSLIILGKLKWSTIFKGLGAIALTLGVLAVVGAVAAPALTALAIALGLMSVSVVVVAAGIYLMAKGFALLGEEGTKGVGVMVAAITAFIALIPKMVIDFLKGLVEILKGLVTLAPLIAESLVKIIGTFLTAMVDLFPKAAVLIGELLQLIIKILDEHAPPLIAAGIRLLVNFLTGIANNIGKVTEQVIKIITGFLSAVAANAPKLAASGANALAAWLKGIATHIGRVIEHAANVIIKFLEGIAKNLPKVYASGVKVILAFMRSIAEAVPKMVRAGVDIIVGFMEGISKAIPRLIEKAVSIIVAFIRAIGKEAPRIADAGAKAAIDFLNGLADAIRDNDEKLFKAMRNVGDAIIDGLLNGLEEGADAVKDKLLEIAKGGVNKVLGFFGISSPSKLFMEIGKYNMLGFAKGMSDNAKLVTDSTKGVGEAVIGTVRDTFGIHSPSEVMRQLGQYVGEGFAQGLHGSQDDIRNAFKDLNLSLHEQIRSSKQIIAEEQAKIDEELKNKKPDLALIKESQKVIAQNELILRKSRQAHSELTTAMSSERNTLLRLTKDYERVSQKLEAARSALDAAKSARDNAKASLTDKFSTTPTIDKDSSTMVADYVLALREQITATKSYTDTLAKLRALGLDDKTYQKLLDEGLAGKEFAESLLQGGKTAVDGVNQLDAELLAASTTLATNAATALYQAGVDAAQGLVNGLKTKKKDLADTMDFIADELVRAIKRKLRIKSPSQVFAEIGKFSVEGMAQGFKNGAKTVTDAASSVGTDAVSAIRNSIADISSAIAENIDADPVITPVLDLSNVKKSALELNDLTNVTPITAAPSFRQASAISEETAAALAAQAEAASTGGPTFEFKQYNTSPDKLSEIEIYRQTGNQLAQAKAVLGLKS